MDEDDDTTPPSSGHQTAPVEVVVNVKAWAQIAKSFLYVEVSSLVLMFACIGSWYESAYVSYALSVAVVSLVVCLIMQTGEFVKPGFSPPRRHGRLNFHFLDAAFFRVVHVAGMNIP